MLLEIILIALVLLVFVLMVSVGYIIGGYNRLTNWQLNVTTQWSNIKAEYQRRADLFYNLVEAVKSYKKFEKETLLEVTKARSGIQGKDKPTEMKTMRKIDNAFGKLLSGLNVVFEKYPDLKSNEQHNKLMDEVRITEDRINVSRTDYNDVVRNYNSMVRMFPSNIIAGMFHFNEEVFFENDEESNKPVRMNLA